MESNHLMPPYQDGAHPESFAGMDPSGRLELPCQRYRSCGSPSILAGNGSGDGSRTHSAALRVPYAAVNISPEEQNLEPRAEVESAYPIYKTGASPSMLAGHGNAWAHLPMVRGTGLEPVSEDWQPSILAARRTQQKMEREERIELPWPAWKAGTHQ